MHDRDGPAASCGDGNWGHYPNRYHAGDELWKGIRRERSAVGPLTRFDSSPFRSHNAAEVSGFVPTDHLEAKRARRLDRFGQFSVVAARMAIEDAQLDLAREDRERVGR